jgi:glycosyltransferase involved in cell wall biosynthesis
MKISVITVCYNSARSIAAAMESVTRQTHQDLDYILVDGASTDGTLDVIRENSSRVTTLISEKDRGIYDAMNKGLAAATGDVICFLNSDDAYADPFVLEKVARTMQDPDIDALFGDVAFVKADHPDKIIRRYRSDRFTPERLAWGWMPAHPAMFLRSGIYREHGPFRTDFRIAGDFDFIVRAFGKGEVRYKHVPEIFVKMQVGGASTSGLRSKLLLNREVLRACRDNGIKTNMLKILSKYPLKALELVGL